MSTDLSKYFVVFLTALGVTYFLTPWVRMLACRYGVMDLPNERRPHKNPTARGGGVAVVIGIYAACLVALAMGGFGRSGEIDLHWLLRFAGPSLILVAVGLVDDVRGMRALQKLAGQVLAAALMAWSGTSFGKTFDMPLPPALDSVLVVVWIVGVINAFNLIDGLDGLASGLGLISATGLSGVLILGHQPGDMVLLVALGGACLAFLRYNFYPATIFLGDTGSMFIGFVLGVESLETFSKSSFVLSIAIPLLVLGVPIFDSLLAVWRRTVRGMLKRDGAGSEGPKPGGIMTADLEHLHHRLLRSGLSTRRVAVLLYLTNGLLIFFGLLMATFTSHVTGIFLLALLAVVYVLLRHMAVIELRDTGKMLLTGLRRPSHTLLKAMAYPVWDMISLSGALAIAMLLLGSSKDGFGRAWFLDLPLWVTPTFSLLALSRTYVTVWTRARVLDVLMLLFTLQAGLWISLGVALLIDPNDLSGAVLRALITASVGHGAILTSRVFYRAIEEIVLYLKSRYLTDPSRPRIVLYGAGGRCQLFLKERGFNDSASFDNREIAGLIDDEPALHFKWVYGHPVLGGACHLPQLVARHRITGIVITATLRREAVEAVQAFARAHQLHLSEWRFENRELSLNKEPAKKSDELSDKKADAPSDLVNK